MSIRQRSSGAGACCGALFLVLKLRNAAGGWKLEKGREGHLSWVAGWCLVVPVEDAGFRVEVSPAGGFMVFMVARAFWR